MQLRTEHIYREFLRLTRRLSNSQIMMLLAVVVGILAGLGTYLFEILLHGIKSGPVSYTHLDVYKRQVPDRPKPTYSRPASVQPRCP